MFENEFLIKITKEDATLSMRFLHLTDTYRHYWNYTHNPKFLYLYQQNLKQQILITHYLQSKYMKNKFYPYFNIDLSNNFLVCKGASE